MSGKFALIIGNTDYIDAGLAQLTAPGKDTEDFARVLKDQEICAFDQVTVFMNQLSSTVIEAIDEFFDQRKPDDLLVLYFSGHGVRDELGSLYLAVSNTIRSRLRSTAVKSDYIREAMDQSRSKRQVVILDCCNSGAFPQGTKAEAGGMMGMLSALQGYGRFVLTASDATQFAWEGDKVIGETQNSLFTHFLVKGLEGEADSDSDGNITVDELYDFAFEQISKLTPKQTPTKSATKQEGEIVLRQITRIADIKPIPLPVYLINAIENPDADVRLGAVQSLTKLLAGKNRGLARSAREVLERIAKDDDSRRVAQAAEQAIESILQQERATREKAKAEREARHEALRRGEARSDIQTPAREIPLPAADRKVVEEAARGTTEKATEEQTHSRERKLPPVSAPLPIYPQRAGLRKWARGAGIVGGLGVIGLVLFWVGSRVFPPLAIIPTESTDIATIASTNTLLPTTTPTLMATTTSIAAFTDTESPLPSPTNDDGSSQNPIPSVRVVTLIPSFTPPPTPTSPPTLTPTPTSDPCGPLPTRVRVGITIQVTTSGQVTRLGIRPEPTLDSNKIFELLPGDPMSVLGGPKCSYDSYFWYISSQKGEGWVREGNGQFYFVDPLP